MCSSQSDHDADGILLQPYYFGDLKIFNRYLYKQNKLEALNEELENVGIRKNSVDSEGVIYERDHGCDTATNVETQLIPSLEPGQVEHDTKSCNDIKDIG